MGCVESRLGSDLQPNVFHVVNVNERGQRQRSARLEVTDTHLILHQRGRAPIRWPLRCLRRYGFDAEQFSFESGRRCPTGPGIYNFKCRRAEALFNMLQYQIQNIAEDAASRDLASMPSNPEQRELSRTDSRTSAAIDSQGYLEPLPRPRTRVHNSISGASISSPPAPPGANGGVAGIVSFASITAIGGGLRSPSSPAPLSPPAVAHFGNPETAELPEDSHTPQTPGITDPQLSREPPSTPLDSSRNIIMNYIDRTVSYMSQSDRPSSYSSSGSDRPVSLINNIGLDRSQSYVNQSDRPLSLAKIDSSAVEDLMRCRQHHLYMNVDTDVRRERDHVYANLGLDKEMPIVPPRTSGGSGSSHSGTTTTTDTEQPISQINYIQVDLDRGSDSSQAVPLSPLGSVASVVPEFPRTGSISATTRGYATIDFDKTEALSSTAKAAAMWKNTGDGVRRTRHNSTFAPIPALGRHNSTLSD